MTGFIPGFNNLYIITEYGLVINTRSGHACTQWLNDDGYPMVRIRTPNGEYKNFRVHRLVALTFIPNPDPINRNIVLHKDNNRSNPHVSNLYWGTVQENNLQSIMDNTHFIPNGKTNYVIVNENGENATGFYFPGLKNISSLLECKNSNSCARLIKTGRKVSNGPFKGLYPKRYDEYLETVENVG